MRAVEKNGSENREFLQREVCYLLKSKSCAQISLEGSTLYPIIKLEIFNMPAKGGPHELESGQVRTVSESKPGERHYLFQKNDEVACR